jgi:hypothetical protein
LLIGIYLNGSYVYQNIDTAFEQRRPDTAQQGQTTFFCVENKSPIENIHVYLQYIISLHQEEVKKNQPKHLQKTNVRDMV